jgi:hypothetical protein
MPTNNYISVLEKGVRVLEAFHGDEEVALGELAASDGPPIWLATSSAILGLSQWEWPLQWQF